MKKLFALFFCGVFFTVSAFSQMSVNPSHSFYSDAQCWFLKGLTENLPPSRPYPVLVIKSILESVIEKGDEKDSLLAKEYYEELTGKKFYVNFDNEYTYKSMLTEKDDGDIASGDSLTSLYQHIEGDVGFKDDFVSFGYKIGFALRTSDEESDYLPYANRTMHDAIQDPATIGSLKQYLDADDVIALGTRNVFIQGGVFRNAFGSLYGKGLALNESDYHKGTLSFTYLGKRLRYNQQMSVIGATLCYDGSELFPDKFLAFHSLSYDLFPSLTLTYYENIITGERFDFSYMLPAPYMACQGIGGNSDNLQMGIMIELHPVQGFLWTTDIFVDDFDVNQMVKLNFDTKLRLAFQTGLVYVPEDSFVRRLSIDWTLVTPFTYSHWDYDNVERDITKNTVGYQSYTNSGLKMGSLYEPNSSAFNFSVDLRPIKNLDITLSASYIQHGNVTESLETEDAISYLLKDPKVLSTDGTVWQHPQFGNGHKVDGAWYKLNLFTQEHLMYVFQGGIKSEYKFPKINGRTQISIKGGWTFEFIHNYGVNTNMYPGLGIADSEGNGGLVKITEDAEGNIVSYEYDGTVYNSAEDLVQIFKDEWIAQLSDRINNYFSLGVAIRF
ncbi:MAG: hypothetical protein J6Z17_04385 [Treponema sp.]|nr:hypothetical protein [Treponema sp.]